ncbi:MAG: right-handed parallel beta-helix repeat-containing protein [Bacteroidetes bacterium]|nr:right-handed parallel beta-helix repeat-containing protein [Bacteroidota bacterium]
MNLKFIVFTLVILCLGSFSYTQEFHVSTKGDDKNPGTLKKPFRTISRAAQVAQPGTTVTVHKGIYRERVNPPRGGDSDKNRIIYQAAIGEEVLIKGSEVINNWERFKGSVWKATIPKAFFGDYNPYKDLVHGDWFIDNGRIHHTGEVYLNGQSLFEVTLIEQVMNPTSQPITDLKAQSLYTWFTESDSVNTYIYANFHSVNPNKELVEINVRKACFYPEKTGVNYITVRGFRMAQAATQWAPPTAEQIGLIGTNWSKGWVIENNVISDSKCSGISLGKDRASGQNLWSLDPSIDGATHYNKLIDKVLGPPYNWSKENIGSHLVRNNIIFNCEQAGIVGSMGCAFSLIENNHIYDIWTKRQFRGAEIAGIKLHGAIDAVIRDNRINNSLKGIWLDWMTQGTRITGNLIYDIYLEDLFVEVNHGPFTVDNNLLLSNSVGILDGSGGGAYVHNLVNGKIVIVQQDRNTPYHKPHSTVVLGRAITKNADNRYYNNWFTSVDRMVNEQMPNGWWIDRGSYGLGIYRGYSPMYVDGNIYFRDAEPFPEESNQLKVLDLNPRIRLEERGNEVYLYVNLDSSIFSLKTQLVDTELLGRAKVPEMWFENQDGSPLVIDRDYFGNKRNKDYPMAGPFEPLDTELKEIKIWPKTNIK